MLLMCVWNDKIYYVETLAFSIIIILCTKYVSCNLLPFSQYSASFYVSCVAHHLEYAYLYVCIQIDYYSNQWPTRVENILMFVTRKLLLLHIEYSIINSNTPMKWKIGKYIVLPSKLGWIRKVTILSVWIGWNLEVPMHYCVSVCIYVSGVCINNETQHCPMFIISQKWKAFVFGNIYIHQTFTESVSNQYTSFEVLKYQIYL